MRAWRVIGGKTIALGLISLAFVVIALALLIAGRAGGVEPLLALLFFGSCLLLVITHAFERKQALVGGNVTGLHALRITALASLSLAFVGFGFAWPGVAMWLRVFFIAAGAAGVLGTILHATRRAVTTIEVTPDGLLQRSRKATLLTPWQDVHDVAISEISGNVALVVRVVEDDGRARMPHVIECRGNQRRLRAKLARGMAFSNTWFGCHWFVMQAHLDRPLADVLSEIARAKSAH